MPTNLYTLSSIAAACAGFTVLLSATAIAQASLHRPQIMLTSPQGDPLPGAGIYSVIPMMTRVVQAAGATDANGSFQIPPNATHVIVVPVHGATTFFAVANDGKRLAHTPEHGHRGTIAISTQVSIRVVDERSRPIRNAILTVFPTDDRRQVTGEIVGGDAPNLPAPLMARLTGHTDRDGRLTLKDLPQGGRISVTMQRKPDQPAMELAGSILLASSPVSPERMIRIPTDRIISGRVTYRQSGRPVPDTLVSLLGPGYHNWVGRARTDRSGRYRYTGLAPANYSLMIFNGNALQLISAKTGEFRYCAVQRSRNGKWHNPASGVGASLVKNKIARDIDFELVKMAVIDGSLVKSDGQPIANADVTANLPDGSGEGHPTDSQGHFHFRLPPGRVHLTWASTIGKPSHSGPTFTLAEGDVRTVFLKETR